MANAVRDYDQYTDECPKCHHRECLTVFEVTLARNGKVEYPETRLYPDGFDVPSVLDGDGSTEDEKVRCDSCGEIFALAELELPDA